MNLLFAKYKIHQLTFPKLSQMSPVPRNAKKIQIVLATLDPLYVVDIYLKACAKYASRTGSPSMVIYTPV